MPAQASDGRAVYWRKNLNLTAVLLAVWFGITFVVVFFARDLSFRFFGWPFGFWVGAQGALLIYLAIIGIYAGVMNRLDRAHGADEQDD